MDRLLKGKRALVTGGGRGIGAAIVKRLAREGADIALTYISRQDEANKTAAAVKALGVRALAIQADAGDVESAVMVIEKTAQEFGGLDILVNNAGIALMAPIDSFTLKDFDRMFAVNVCAVFVSTQAAVRHMKAGGRVINIGSCNAERIPTLGGAAYAMSKAALVGLVKGLSRELGPRGITINNVQPGPVDTDRNPDNSEFAKTVKGYMAIPRYGHVEEIAGMVAYLVGPEGAFVTGAEPDN